jgi:hypothetical protein
MKVTSKCAIKNIGTYLIFFQLFTYFSPQLFIFRQSLYFLFDMSYNFSHLHTNSINFISISEDRQAALVANKHPKCSGDDVRLHKIGIE